MARTKKCPYCGELILEEAIKCRFCKEFLVNSDDLPVSYHAKNISRSAALGDDSMHKQDYDEIEEIFEERSGQQNKVSGNNRISEKNIADKDMTIKVTPSLLGLFGDFILAGLLATIGCLLITVRFGDMAIHYLKTSEQIAHYIDKGTGMAGLIIIFVIVVTTLWKIVKLKAIQYEVCVDRVEFTRGIFDRRIDNLDMFRVVDLKLHRSLLDILMGVGSVALVTKDESDPVFEFEKIRDPKKLYDIIKSASLIADRKQHVVHLD